MKLKKLLDNLEILNVEGPTGVNIKNITDNSINVKKDNLFVAINGLTVDGHDYVIEAIKNGAIVVVIERDIKINLKNKRVTIVKVKNSRKALAILAANFYNNPSNKLKLIGITGTNGKSTTCEFVYQLLKQSNIKVGLISTISIKYSDNKEYSGPHVTTPNPLVLHKLIAKMARNNCEYIILEMTSHGIDQHRTWGIGLEICAITNVTPEHLDYHKTFNQYLKTKAKIFEQSKKIILNRSYPSFNKLLKLVPEGIPLITVNVDKINIPTKFTRRLPGKYNKENAILANAVVTELLGSSNLAILSNIKVLKGRFEFIKCNKPFNIVVDFAHDTIALNNVLKVSRSITKNNLILVFGCAGLRDKLKRPKMGMIAIKLADKTIITAEDPRTEKLEDINMEIEVGAKKAGGIKNKDYYIIENRQDAINFAVNKLAKKGDLILITGKGHEKSMCFGNREYPWSEHGAIKKALRNSYK